MLVGQGQVYYQDASDILYENIEELEKQVKDLYRALVIQGFVIGGIIGTLLAWWIFKII